MIIFSRKHFYFMIIFSLILFSSVFMVKAARLQTTVSHSFLFPGEEIEVELRLLDDDGQLKSEDRSILVKVDKGGLLNYNKLRDGIKITAGKAKFTYVAPVKPGTGKITLLDLKDNITRVLTFEVRPEAMIEQWKQEYAFLKDINGDVFVKYMGKENWDTGDSSKKIYEGDNIKILRDSFATLELFDGSEIVLEPGTELFVKSLASLQGSSNQKKGIFELIKGKVLCTAKGFINRGSQFSIETESAAAGVRGTYYEVYVEGGKTVVTVYRGSVLVVQKTTGLNIVTKEGESLVLTSGEEKPEIISHRISEQGRMEELLDNIKNVQEKNKADSGGDNDDHSNDDQDNGNQGDDDQGDDDQGDDQKQQGSISINPVW